VSVTAPLLGSLDLVPALSRPDLLAPAVRAALEGARETAPDVVAEVWVAPIDPISADTAAFCAAYGVPPEASANCVVVRGSRGGELRTAACVVLSTTRADVNGTVRRRLDVRKASFAPMDDAVAETGMAYGGITPIGLPGGWLVLVEAAVAGVGWAVVGSGIRGSKLVLPGPVLAEWQGVETVEGLARSIAS
jgi:prolyl-tRNA editing enzyme YbaK/EbsC (Cys-tRNA(Pro) deacylase)